MSSASLSKEERSDSVPFRKRNPVLDGRFPGDAQFDPLFLAENDELFFNYREAEVKVSVLTPTKVHDWHIIVDGNLQPSLSLLIVLSMSTFILNSTLAWPCWLLLDGPFQNG